MEQKRVCPVFSAASMIVAKTGGRAAQLYSGEPWCRGLSCAWYDAAAGCCAVLSLARAAAGKGRP